SDRPGPVLKNLDGDACGDSEVKIEFTLEVLEVPVPVDKARQHRASRHVEDVGDRGNAYFTATGNRLEPSPLDQDPAARKRHAAGPVNQTPTFDNQRSTHHQFHSRHRQLQASTSSNGWSSLTVSMSAAEPSRHMSTEKQAGRSSAIMG